MMAWLYERGMWSSPLAPQAWVELMFLLSLQSSDMCVAGSRRQVGVAVLLMRRQDSYCALLTPEEYRLLSIA